MALTAMEYRFKHSKAVMTKLAQESARTPPSEEDQPFEYIDRSLTILGRTLESFDQRMRREFLDQREFVTSQIRGVEERIDKRFKDVDRRFEEVDKRFDDVDKRFENLEHNMNTRFEEMEGRVDRRFDKTDGEIRDIKVQLENSSATTRNGRLCRMHQPINLIRVLRPTSSPDVCKWEAHPEVPKHMKNLYLLGQRAKGDFDSTWDVKSDQQKAQAKLKALRTISELARFYGVVIYSDAESESDATEVDLQEFTVDEYMEALLDEWGMDWQKILKLGQQHMQASIGQRKSGTKRLARTEEDTTNVTAGAAEGAGQRKRTRG